MLRILICLVSVWLVGCGGGPSDLPDLGEVSGVVKVDGKPAPNIRVTFQPEEGRPSTAVTNESGEYTLKYSESESGAKVGKHLVKISTQPPVSEDCGCGCGCGGCGGEAFLDPIHPKYNTDARNNPDMTKEVTSGSQEINFEVETDLNARKAGQSGGGRRVSGCCCE